MSFCPIIINALPFGCPVVEPPHVTLLVVALDPHCIPVLELGAADWLVEELFQLIPPPELLLSPPQLMPPDGVLLVLCVPPQLTPPPPLLELKEVLQPDQKQNIQIYVISSITDS